jgi:hypothetical protein
VSVGVLVAVGVAVAVLVGVLVGVGVGVLVAVGVALGGTAVSVGVIALISVAAKSTLAVAACVGSGSFSKEVGLFAKTVTPYPIRPVTTTTIPESRRRFLMITSPGERNLKMDFIMPDNQKPLII